MKLTDKTIKLAGIIIFVLLCCIPVLLDFPYRPNLYLTWEGAYRLYLGQIPYVDFGLSVGPGMWIIPALFFLLFGPSTFSLILAQIVINITSGLLLAELLRRLKVSEAVIFIGLIVFYFTYIIVHFWPWYNHSVFFYQLVSLYFLVIFLTNKSTSYLYLLFAALFTCISFLTKQDGGGLAWVIVNVLLLYTIIKHKQYKPFLLYNTFFLIGILLFFISFKSYDVFYWFNYGQFPHTSRLYLADFLHDFFTQSVMIKLFLAIISIVAIKEIVKSGGIKSYLKESNYKFDLFLLLCFSIMIESLIIQVTSFSPPETKDYFYAFGTVFFLFYLEKRSFISFRKSYWLIITVILVSIIWSGNQWKYGEKLFPVLRPGAKGGYAISKYDLSNEEGGGPVIKRKWVKADLPTISNMKFPKQSLQGMHQLIDYRNENMPDDIRVLNMTQLTFLAKELNFIPEKGSKHPLWYHKGVNVFDREVDYLCDQVRREAYDIIIFQDIPPLRDYFPYEVLDCIPSTYRKVDEFPTHWNYLKSKAVVYIKNVYEKPYKN